MYRRHPSDLIMGITDAGFLIGVCSTKVLFSEIDEFSTMNLKFTS